MASFNLPLYFKILHSCTYALNFCSRSVPNDFLGRKRVSMQNYLSCEPGPMVSGSAEYRKKLRDKFKNTFIKHQFSTSCEGCLSHRNVGVNCHGLRPAKAEKVRGIKWNSWSFMVYREYYSMNTYVLLYFEHKMTSQLLSNFCQTTSSRQAAL